MPALPWTSRRVPSADEELLALAAHLPLKRFSRSPRFFRDVRAIQRQLSRADGLVGFSLLARPIRRLYWTLSVWNDEAALMGFVRAMPHVEVMRKLRPDLGKTAFVRWTVRGAATPPSWDEAMSRLSAASSGA